MPWASRATMVRCVGCPTAPPSRPGPRATQLRADAGPHRTARVIGDSAIGAPRNEMWRSCDPARTGIILPLQRPGETSATIGGMPAEQHSQRRSGAGPRAGPWAEDPWHRGSACGTNPYPSRASRPKLTHCPATSGASRPPLSASAHARRPSGRAASLNLATRTGTPRVPRHDAGTAQQSAAYRPALRRVSAA